MAYGDVEDVKQLADQVSPYTNLFVLGCTAVTHDRLKLEEACQYLYDKGLYFVVYQEYPVDYNWLSASKSEWVQTAKERWGNQFLGIYFTDEIGGRQLDHVYGWMTVEQAENYSDATLQFNQKASDAVSWFRDGYSGGDEVTLFTSDYALYWFDYQAGYDVVLAQLGWNYSRQLNVALCRGAATAQNKDWGAMITWTFKQPPYMESGPELYADLVLAYDSGAKYIMVFDSNKQYTAGTLKEEHHAALKQFWQYTKQNPRNPVPVGERAAYVLPQAYAYGFRGPNDKIWGLWEADLLSTPISVELSGIIEQHGSNLDIIYDDALGLISSRQYASVVYWNSSDEIPLPSASPTSSGDTTRSRGPLGSLLDLFSFLANPIVWVALAAVLATTVGVILFVKGKQPKAK
ncbi:MAG: hypothetical protein NWE93_09260 [Candidatus Bathyarchaeota archaeon]|nr:hypothetical protein [Candidatus Bathyarchaeota archaeon]